MYKKNRQPRLKELTLQPYMFASAFTDVMFEKTTASFPTVCVTLSAPSSLVRFLSGLTTARLFVCHLEAFPSDAGTC